MARESARAAVSLGASMRFSNHGDEFSASMLWPVPVVSNSGALGFRARADRHQFPPYSVRELVRLNPSWIEFAELVIVRAREAGSVERVLEVPALPLRISYMQ
jgi:hypothetical protein